MSFESHAERRFAYKAHKARLARYEAILAGNLTPAQRDFVNRRVEREHRAARDLGVPWETTSNNDAPCSLPLEGGDHRNGAQSVTLKSKKRLDAQQHDPRVDQLIARLPRRLEAAVRW